MDNQTVLDPDPLYDAQLRINLINLNLRLLLIILDSLLKQVDKSGLRDQCTPWSVFMKLILMRGICGQPEAAIIGSLIKHAVLVVLKAADLRFLVFPSVAGLHEEFVYRNHVFGPRINQRVGILPSSVR